MTVPGPLVAAVVFAAVWLFVVPALVLAHEFGHATLALAFTEESVTVVVGGDRWRFERGRLTVEFDPGGWRRWWYGRCRSESEADVASRWRVVAIYLGGPAASAATALAVLALTVGAADGRWVRFGLSGAFWYCVFQLAFTLAPLTYSWGPYDDLPSDGLQAWRVLTGE